MLTESDIGGQSAVDLSKSIQQGLFTAEELTKYFLERASTANERLHCFYEVLREHALSQARELDEKRQRGQNPGVLAGLPVGLKDNFVTEGLETRCGSKILEGWIPPYEGYHARRLKEAGAVLLGKCAMDEFAMGSSNENTPYETVRNPWATDFVPGGSSGGTASAVSAGACAFGLGSDTGGSIRQPASFCGVVGFKPSYGRISRQGMIAFASSLDQAGPIARNVRDAALIFDALKGHDPNDATSRRDECASAQLACEKSLTGLRVGLHREALELDGLNPEVRRIFEMNVAQLKDAGATIVDIELPHFRYGISAYYICCSAEASSNLARYDGIRYGQQVKKESLSDTYQATRNAGFGPEVKRRILLGTQVLRASSYEKYYGRAMKVRTLIAEDYRKAFENCDVIASPTSPVPAFRIGEKNKDPLSMYLADIFTVGVNLARLPAISVPGGFSAESGEKPRLPIGFQLIGPEGGDEVVFQSAAAFEKGSDWGGFRKASSGDASGGAA